MGTNSHAGLIIVGGMCYDALYYYKQNKNI